MSKLVTGSHVGVLEGDADNIVELILDSYARITSSVQVKVQKQWHAHNQLPLTDNCYYFFQLIW